MQVAIQNYRGLASASLDLSRLCLLAAPNAGGKTSAAQALSAALTGDPVPIRGVKKSSAGLLVRAGTASGSVVLTTEEGRTEIQWPSAKVKTEGNAPFASHFAVGLQTIVNLEEKERVKVLTEYLKATPAKTDLANQLKPMNYNDAKIDRIWAEIERLGWDGLQKHYETERAGYKKVWMDVAGEQYGSKKAESWMPEGWEHDLEGKSEDTLQAVVTDARDALEAAIAADAVDDSKRADVEALAGLLSGRNIDAVAAESATIDPALKNQLEECNGMIATMAENRDDLNKKLQALPSAKQQSGMSCPDCGAVLQVQGGILEKAATLTDEEMASRQEAIAEIEKQIVSVSSAIAKHMEAAARIKGQINEAEASRMQKITECKRLVKESEAAAKELEKPVAAASNISVEDCRTTVKKAESRLKAFTQKTKATLQHRCVEALEKLIPLIAPEGIRGDVLVKALKTFNESLAPFVKIAGWNPVTLESDFMPTYGGTQYELLSESEKFRVRVVLQVGMARIDRSEALVIDAADILDKNGRNGLFKAVKSTGLPAFVSMTIDDKSLVPNLAKAGIGVSYWINEKATAESV